ncbi:MAG: hypothetical protein QXV69_05135 [Sulfolobaceae archaeon]
MNCVKELPTLYIYSWIGDSKLVNSAVRECLKDYDNIKEIQKTIREILISIDSEIELPKALRDKGITYVELFKLGLYKILKSITKNQISLETVEEGKLKYSIIDLEYKKIIRGFCGECKGKKIGTLKRSNGIFIQYQQMIYAEIFSNDIKNGIKELIENLE